MQTPKKFSSFSDQVSWISDEKGIKINDREYAEEMLRQIGYFPLMGGYKHLFRISNMSSMRLHDSVPAHAPSRTPSVPTFIAHLS